MSAIIGSATCAVVTTHCGSIELEAHATRLDAVKAMLRRGDLGITRRWGDNGHISALYEVIAEADRVLSKIADIPKATAPNDGTEPWQPH